MARRKATRRSSPTSTGKKLVPTIKKQGLLKGSGMFAAKQTGIKALSKIVLGAALSRSVSTVPVVGELTNTAVSYGTMLRSRLGR